MPALPSKSIICWKSIEVAWACMIQPSPGGNIPPTAMEAAITGRCSPASCVIVRVSGVWALGSGWVQAVTVRFKRLPIHQVETSERTSELRPLTSSRWAGTQTRNLGRKLS